MIFRFIPPPLSERPRRPGRSYATIFLRNASVASQGAHAVGLPSIATAPATPNVAGPGNAKQLARDNAFPHAGAANESTR